MLLKNKNAVITGCAKGIGKSILNIFAENGANIWACVRKPDEEFENYIGTLSEKNGVKITAVYFDLVDTEQIKAGMKTIMSTKENVDILINNAGVAHGGFLQMTTLSTIREVFEINFFSQFLIIQYISKLMMRQKSGSIINIASIGGLDGYPGFSAYGSSKAALIYLTKTLAKELAPYNIRIGAVAPGLTETNMATKMEVKAKEAMISGSSMKRMAKPEEIAKTVLFLASDLSSFITGQVIRVDGGSSN